MRRIIAASLLVFFVVVLTMACSSDSPTLQLGSGPITEDEFRTQILQMAFARADTFDILCSAAKRLPPEELIELYDRADLFDSGASSAASAEHAARAAEILIEECEDLT